MTQLHMEIIGHKKQQAMLNRSIEKKTMAHAYLFLGPENVGKFTLAFELAKKLTGKNDEIVDADLLVVRPEDVMTDDKKTDIKKKKIISKKREIKIEQIRDLQKHFNLFPESGKHRVAIIDEAERLNKQAQNALLKILEEPNDFSIIFLISKNDKKLLATLISRCQKIKFNPLTLGEIEEWGSQKGLFDKKENKDDIVFWSLGRPGLVLKLLNDEDEMVKRKKAYINLENLMDQNLTEKFFLAEEMAKDKESAIGELGLWIILLRENFLNKGKIKISATRALHFIEKINESLIILRDTNSNARLILENLFLQV